MTGDGIPHHDDALRSLRDPEVLERRRAMLFQPHMLPLVAYVDRLRQRYDGYVPDFDPLDGGINARILFLFEKPGAKADPSSGGSGFVSRNNDDPSAAATFTFMTSAGIPRRETVTWNLVPWWRKMQRAKRVEIAIGLREMADLLALLPRLDTVVLIGAAAAVRPRVSHLRVIESAHPSPVTRARNPGRWCAIPATWRQAARECYDGHGTVSQRHFSELDYE